MDFVQPGNKNFDAETQRRGGKPNMAVFQHRILRPGFLAIVLAIANPFPFIAQTAADPPKELLLYVRDAMRRGVEVAKIRQEAQTVGWSAAVIDEAMTRETTANSAPMGRAPGAVSLPGNRSVSDDYLIGAGDSLQISVWKEPDASVPSVVVRPDGRITVPLIKEVEVAGLTPRQAEKTITEGLSKFMTDPNVTVVLAAINSKRIYVIGAVKKEGTLPYSYGITVMQALSESGGLTDYARRRKIYILRSENSREYRLDFNYEEVVRGERPEQNIVLQPGDTVIIPN
jgi:polysaccharide biosynthesis/export protein